MSDKTLPTLTPEELENLKPLKRLRKSIGIQNLWVWILKLLREEKKYGYELRDELKNRFGIKPATVTSYSVLYKLQREGATEKAEAAASTRIDRKYYHITEKGTAMLKQAEMVLKDVLILLDSSPDQDTTESHVNKTDTDEDKDSNN